MVDNCVSAQALAVETLGMGETSNVAHCTCLGILLADFY